VEAEMLPEIPVDVKSVSPQIKIISDLIEWIFPSNVITLSGYLEKPGDKGAGLTLSIVENQTGNILGNITIWQKDYDPATTQSAVKDNDPVPYYCLVEPAAIWAHYQLSATSGEDAEKSAHTGISDWQSYAYLRAGTRWRLENQDDKARLMFLNVRNRYEDEALFNLGVLHTEAGEYERALERLERVKESTTSKKILWYNAEYYLALTYRYKGDLLRAKEEAKLLVNTISNTISGLDNNKKLRDSLKDFKPMACIMYANTLVYAGELKEAESMIKPLDPFRLTYRARYNLACHYSIYGEKAAVDVEQRTAAYKMALWHLEYALERGGGIVEWAKKDIALKGVRENNETKDAFAKLIKKYGGQDAQDSADLPLAGLAIIKEAYAKQLKEQGIFSHCDLILKADTPQAQEALAKKFGISTTLLRRWALLAD
jgi:tetratricopeptide (TPR) repeat protein